MKKNIVNTFLLLITCVCTSYAAPTLKNILHPKKLKQQMQNKMPVGSYADFSGNWISAKCMGSEMVLDIENTDESISINGEESLIGTMTTNSNSGQANPMFHVTRNEVSFIEWSTDRTQLIIKSIDIEKTFNSPENPVPIMDSAVLYNMSSATLSLDKEQLVIKFRTAEYKDFQRLDSSQPTCVFTKNDE